MSIKEIINERFYIIVAIGAVLSLFLLPLSFGYYAYTDGTYQLRIVSLFTYIVGATRSGVSNVSEVIFNASIWEDGYIFMFSLNLIMVIAGAALLTIAGVATDKEKIQKLFPGIAIGLMLFTILSVLPNLTISTGHFGTVPLLIREYASYTLYSTFGPGFWISAGILVCGGIKYLLSDK